MTRLLEVTAPDCDIFQDIIKIKKKYI